MTIKNTASLKTAIATAAVLVSATIALPASAAGLSLGLHNGTPQVDAPSNGFGNGSAYEHLNLSRDNMHFGDSKTGNKGLFSQSGSSSVNATIRLSNTALYWE